MDSMISMDSARAFVADSALWPLARDFLWDFAPQVHKSWLEGLKVGPTDDSGMNILPLLDFRHKTSSPRLKAWVLEQLGVEPFFHTFPKEDGSRLALLDGATLESIAKWLGALACAESLRRIADGATVRSLKSALTGVYPSVFGFTMYFRNIPASVAKNADDVIAAGYGLLLSAIAGGPNQVFTRMKMKLPKDSPFASLSPSNVRVLDGEERGGLDAALSKLLKLKFPEAYSICCS